MSKIEAREIAEEMKEIEVKEKEEDVKQSNKRGNFPIGILALIMGLPMLGFGISLFNVIPGITGHTLEYAYTLGLSNGSLGLMCVILGAVLIGGGIASLRQDFKDQIQDSVKKALDEYEED